MSDYPMLLVGWIQRYRRPVFWALIALALVWLVAQVKEVASLLLLSYVLALLLDPLLSRAEKRGLDRGGVLLALGFLLSLLCLIVVLLGVPALVKQSQVLLALLPSILAKAFSWFAGFSNEWFGAEVPTDVEAISQTVKSYLGHLDSRRLSDAFEAVTSTLLQGYSWTLTLINLSLLPFFIFYIARDLHGLHSGVAKYLRPELKSRISDVGREILGHVHAFVRGQVTVSLLMAGCYIVGLWIVGLPYALPVGLISGLLNIVPYLGLSLGVVFAGTITLFNDPSWTQVGLVAGVFVFVQFLEGSFFTPRIVGESVGIHPLGVMIALVVGGQLFGLLGLVAAVPAAAAIRVLFHHGVDIVSGESQTIVVGSSGNSSLSS